MFHLDGAGRTIPRDHTTLGEALRNNGYRTFGIGKWHNGTESFNRNFNTGALKIRDEELASFPRTPEEIRRHIAEYYAMISHLDHHLGRVIKTLEDQNMLEDTIVVFAGDNGLAVGQHELVGKQSCYDHSVRVPLIFAGPGIRFTSLTPMFNGRSRPDAINLLNMRRRNGDRVTQLFDLEANPWERENLAFTDAGAEKIRELRKELARWRDAWEDQDSE